MKIVEIEDRDYETIARTYGDFARFVKQEAAKLRKQPEKGAPKNFLEAASRGGLLSGGSENLPADLSSNPKHMEGFGR